MHRGRLRGGTLEKGTGESGRPFDVMVDDRGKAVVTFGDVGREGVTERAVVLYGDGGTLLRQCSVEEIFSPEAVSKFCWSMSSCWWRRAAWFDYEKDELVLWASDDYDVLLVGLVPPRSSGELRAVVLSSGAVRKAAATDVRRTLSEMGEKAPLAAMDMAIQKRWRVAFASTSSVVREASMRGVRLATLQAQRGNVEARDFVTRMSQNPENSPAMVDARFYMQFLTP